MEGRAVPLVPPLLPSLATPLPFLSCCLSYSNSRHKTLHFGENFMKIGPKLKKLLKGQFYVYSLWSNYCAIKLYFVTCLVTMHITWHIVPSFLYDHTKSAPSGIPLPSNPSWSTGVDPDQLASSEEANWSGSTLFANAGCVWLSKTWVRILSDSFFNSLWKQYVVDTH